MRVIQNSKYDIEDVTLDMKLASNMNGGRASD